MYRWMDGWMDGCDEVAGGYVQRFLRRGIISGVECLKRRF